MGWEQALADASPTAMEPSGTIQKGWSFFCSWSTSLLSRLFCEFCGNFISLIHLGSQVRSELREEFWLCLEVFVAACENVHCILLGKPGCCTVIGGGWCGAEGALAGAQAWTALRKEGDAARWEHRERGDAGQAVVEATWATGARKESCGLVGGMNRFLLLCYTCAGLHLQGLKTALAAGGGQALMVPPPLWPSLIALWGSPGCCTMAAGGISWEFHLAGMKGCLLGLAN